MRTLLKASLVATCFALLMVAPVSGDEGFRGRLRRIESEFAPRYMKLAKGAKRHRYPDLVAKYAGLVEALDPGNDDLIDFDPTVKRPAGKSQQKRRKKLEASFVAIRRDEARARLELALWCDREALDEESVHQAAAALALVPGTVSFNADGVITSDLLGTLPKSLSLSIFEEYEVFGGCLVPLDSLPESIPWQRGWRLKTDHFDIATNVSGELSRTLGRALEAAREIYREETGYEVRVRITVFVPNTRRDYISMWIARERPRPAPTNRGKCYRDFCGVDGSQSTRQVVSVAIHEVAHGYLNLGLEAGTGRKGATMPPWFHEGLATYCAGYGKDSLSWRRGEVNPDFGRDAPLQHFAKMARDGRVMALDEFLTAEEFGADFYYQACAFFWFFHETKDAELKKRFARAATAMKKACLGEDRAERGREIFLETIGMEPAELQRAFLAWAKGADS